MKRLRLLPERAGAPPSGWQAQREHRRGRRRVQQQPKGGWSERSNACSAPQRLPAPLSLRLSSSAPSKLRTQRRRRFWNGRTALAEPTTTRPSPRVSVAEISSPLPPSTTNEERDSTEATSSSRLNDDEPSSAGAKTPGRQERNLSITFLPASRARLLCIRSGEGSAQGKGRIFSSACLSTTGSVVLSTISWATHLTRSQTSSSALRSTPASSALIVRTCGGASHGKRASRTSCRRRASTRERGSDSTIERATAWVQSSRSKSGSSQRMALSRATSSPRRRTSAHAERADDMWGGGAVPPPPSPPPGCSVEKETQHDPYGNSVHSVDGVLCSAL